MNYNNQKLDIHKSHLYALKVCNSAVNWSEKQSFYTFKKHILKKYGNEDGYDLQVIKKECYDCNGTGVFKCNWKPTETCWSCLGSGTYKTKSFILKRYFINRVLFYEPLGELIHGQLVSFDGYYDEYPAEKKFKYNYFDEPIKNTINGIIKHEKISDLNPTFAYYYLLWNYDKTLLLSEINKYVKSMKNYKRQQLNALFRKHNPLKVFADYFKVKNEHIEELDELPF